MALVLEEDFSFKNNQDAFEKAALFFGRIQRLAASALLINEQMQGDFEDPAYRADCTYYQLEAIRDLAGQFDDVFEETAANLGRKSDLRLKAIDEAPAAEAALIADFQAASAVDQDFMLVQSHFMARRYWTEAMRGHLSELAQLCVASEQGRQLGEVLLNDSGEGVLAGNASQAQPFKQTVIQSAGQAGF